MPRTSKAASRDEWRAARRAKRARRRQVSVSLDASSRDRLNDLKRLYKVDDQSMAIDVAWMRATGRAIE